MLKKYIGDKAFYRMVVAVALPIVVQNGISTFVNLLDNLMVGRVGTEAMSGVSVVNQFLFIFNLLIFGAVSAAGIFMAQYHGKGDEEGERYTFRFKFLICLIAGILSIVVLWFFKDALIGWFLTGEDAEGNVEATLAFGREYLVVMLFGLIPYAIASVYASSMRETGDTMTPMIASIVSVAVNFVFNLLLIFGLLGFPALGVKGAAIATVIARLVECGILVVRTHVLKDRYRYIVGAYRSMYLPGALFRDILVRGLPLMLNEFFWSIAVTTVNQCLSVRGYDVVPASNIYSTVWNVFSIVFLAMGNAVAIVVGNQLGAGEIEKAKDTARKMIAFSVACSTATAVLLAAISGVFPLLYKTTDEVRSLASYFILVAAASMPFCAYANAAYYTIRSGGKVYTTILFDSVYMWVIVVPVCFILSRYTNISIYWLFAADRIAETLKCILGAFLIGKGTWARKLVDD